MSAEAITPKILAVLRKLVIEQKPFSDEYTTSVGFPHSDMYYRVDNEQEVLAELSTIVEKEEARNILDSFIKQSLNG